MTALDRSPLGKPTAYPERYDPALLFPIARSVSREALGITGALPFDGVDLWTAYEMTWLDAGGKPQVGVGRFRIPAGSPRIVESKSLKLYLGSFAQESIAESGELVRRIESDLARVCGAPVAVALDPPTDIAALHPASLPGESLDALAIATDVYEPAPALLVVDVLARCAPRALSVYARFLRRGGVDINPFRSNFESGPPDDVRTARQ